MLTALVTLGVIVYGSVLNLKREMTKYEVMRVRCRGLLFLLRCRDG